MEVGLLVEVGLLMEVELIEDIGLNLRSMTNSNIMQNILNVQFLTLRSK